MSKIFNYDSSTIRIVRDDENINFYSKDLLIVYGIFPNVIFEYNGNVVEKLDYTNITSPIETTLNEYVTLFQTWIDEYVPPVPDPTIKLKAHTVGEPDIEIDIAIGTNLSITGNTLNATGGGGGGVQSVTGLNTDNTDPLNPVVKISVDGTTITGDGTSGNPLVSVGSGGGSGILHGTASGTDTYTTTITGVTSYADGDAYLIRFTNGNTTGCTLNINSLGAKTLYRNNDGALIGGDIISGGEMLCVYNSTTNRFQVIGTAPNSLFAYVTNADSVTITKGQPVYAFGGQGDRLTVKRAFNTSDATSAQTVGLVLSTSIAANQKGLIMMQGLLDGLSILPTATWSDGDPVYLGATAGTITKVKPYAPNHLVYLGFVTTASNGSAGRLYVRVQNGYELDELHNVQAQTPTLKDTLWYDNTVSPAQWKTASIPTILGYTPISNVTGTSPIASSGGATPAISIADAVADGTTKGAASFTASDFNSTSGVIAIDYTNGQAASLSNKGFLTSADFTIFNGKQDALSSGVNIKTVQSTSIVGSGDVTITDANLSTSDIATNDVSTSKHGFVPKAPNDTTKFLRGDGTWDVVNNNGGWTIIVKSANQDVTNSATLTDDTDLQFSVVAGGHYMIEMDIVISCNNTTGDYKNAFFVSAGNMLGTGFMLGPNATGVVQTNIYTSNAAATSTTVPLGTQVANIDLLASTKIIYSFQASANATLSYQFANNAAAAGRTSRTWKGSILKYKRID
jgi:hypothetical protein